MKRKILFLTGTRADFGKMRSLVDALCESGQFDVHLFVTGMHMLSRYGLTSREIERRGYRNIYKFINQNYTDTMDAVLGKTIIGLSDYVKEIQPDMLVVHGDRVETLAGASVGCLNNILVAHVEGGEVSGTVDEILRHSVSKLSHLHFVCNERAQNRLMQLGENKNSIYVIGSPDVDAIFSDKLPTQEAVAERYNIPFKRYAILLYHPVTTEADQVERQIDQLLQAAQKCGDNFVVIYPNNDAGSGKIIERYRELEAHSERFRVYPSMRFDYFLSLLRGADYMLGNSSSALMEAPYFGVPAVNVGTRQASRASLRSVINVGNDKRDILTGVERVRQLKVEPEQHFGEGGSDKKFLGILQQADFWRTEKQKTFIDMDL